MPFHDLLAHKGYADAAMLQAIRQQPAAAADADLLAALRHILVSNRFWLLAIVHEPFVIETETRATAPFDALATAFRLTLERDTTWVASATPARLEETLEHALIPGGRCRVSDALLQVCLHSQGHRSQVAKLLRARGGTPPATDFIAWLVNRPAPAWPA
jgi:uncharacterized damage-inducible protein DinB